MKDKKRPKILAIIPGLIPSIHILIIKPLTALHVRGEINFKLAWETRDNKTAIDRADIVVFCRNSEPSYAHNINYVNALEKPYIYNLDDNLFIVPKGSDGANYHNHPARKKMLEFYLRGAAIVRGYSPGIMKTIERYTERGILTSPPIDLSIVKATPKVNKSDSRVKIVYATSRLNDQFMETLLIAIKRVLDEFIEVEFHFWGKAPEDLANHPRVKIHRFINNYDRYLRYFDSYGYDIGLAPMENDEFHNSKTNNKFREYAACHIAGVYSNVEVYSSCVKHRETGFLVPNNSNDWYLAIKELIQNRSLLEEIKKNARTYVETFYSQDMFEEIWLAHIYQTQNQTMKSSLGDFAVSLDEYQNNKSPLTQVLEKILDYGLRMSFNIAANRLYEKRYKITFVIKLHLKRIWYKFTRCRENEDIGND